MSLARVVTAILTAFFAAWYLHTRAGGNNGNPAAVATSNGPAKDAEPARVASNDPATTTPARNTCTVEEFLSACRADPARNLCGCASPRSTVAFPKARRRVAASPRDIVQHATGVHLKNTDQGDEGDPGMEGKGETSGYAVEEDAGEVPVVIEPATASAFPWRAFRSMNLARLQRRYGSDHPLARVLVQEWIDSPGDAQDVDENGGKGKGEGNVDPDNGGVVWLYHEDHPLSHVPDGSGRVIAETHDHREVDLETFERERGEPEKYGWLYYTQPLNTFADGAQDKFLDPIEPLVIEPGNRVDTQIWLGSAGVTTQTHYDMVHNVYLQVEGSKRFIFFPPESYSDLYLTPALHPHHRRSQVNLGSFNLTEFPRFADALTRATEATVTAGEIVYIPPLHFHRVTAGEGSVSANVWCGAAAVTQAWDAVKGVQVPGFGKIFPWGARRAAGRTLITAVLGMVLGRERRLGSKRTPSQFVREMVVQRWAPRWPDPRSDWNAMRVHSLRERAPEDAAVASDPSALCGFGSTVPESLHEKLLGIAVAEVVPALLVVEPGASRDLIMMEWVEMMAFHSYVKAFDVGTFLRECFPAPKAK